MSGVGTMFKAVRSLEKELEAKDQIIAELVEALESEVVNVSDDIRWAEGGELERLVLRREWLESALSKANATGVRE